jgi:hypothetical protein
MGRRSAFSRKQSSGPSTLRLRDEAARAIAERADRYRRELDHATTAKARSAALETLGADLGPLVDRYRERDRTHESLKTDSIAIADGAGLLDRLKKAPWDSPQKKRVADAAQKWLLLPAQRVRVGAEGRPVVLRMAGRHGENLYGSREGRSNFVAIETALESERCTTFEPFIGPELPPDDDQTTCYCEKRHAFVDCPFARPCEGGCGTLTKHGDKCRFCDYPRWVAAAWLVPSKSTLPDLTKVLREAEIETFEVPPLPDGAWGPRWCCRLKFPRPADATVEVSRVV